MANTIQHRRDTAANWTSADTTLSAGQVGVETDTGKFKIGDGSTAWSSLGYFEPAAAYSFQGSAFGYVAGGTAPSNPGGATTDIIQKFSLTTDANATDVGDLTQARYPVSGNTSSSHGYASGGRYTPTWFNIIDKFPFAVDENATDVGDLTCVGYNSDGSSSSTDGYVFSISNFEPGSQIADNSIQKFPFASDTNAADIGDLTENNDSGGGNSSTEYGYRAGGQNPGNPSPTKKVNTIDKFPFATDSNATDVGNLTVARMYVSSQSSTENGYTSGGVSGPPFPAVSQNVIDKFSFSSDGNATDVANLIAATSRAGAGVSSTTEGYDAGHLSAAFTNVIQKFPFASDANATDIADLLYPMYGGGGSQT